MELGTTAAHAASLTDQSGKTGAWSGHVVVVSPYAKQPQVQAALVAQEIDSYASNLGYRQLVFEGLAPEVKDAALRAGFSVTAKGHRAHVIGW